MSTLLDIYNKEIEASNIFSEDTKKSLLDQSTIIQNKLKDPSVSNEEKKQLIEKKDNLLVEQQHNEDKT